MLSCIILSFALCSRTIIQLFLALHDRMLTQSSPSGSSTCYLFRSSEIIPQNILRFLVAHIYRTIGMNWVKRKSFLLQQVATGDTGKKELEIIVTTFRSYT